MQSNLLILQHGQKWKGPDDKSSVITPELFPKLLKDHLFLFLVKHYNTDKYKMEQLTGIFFYYPNLISSPF